MAQCFSKPRNEDDPKQNTQTPNVETNQLDFFQRRQWEPMMVWFQLLHILMITDFKTRVLAGFAAARRRRRRRRELMAITFRFKVSVNKHDSVAASMMGVGAVKTDSTSMVLSGFAGSIAGACSMAIGEVEVAQMKRMEKMKLPYPYQAAFASALSFSIGALVPLLSAAFIRLMVVLIVATLTLTAFGLVGAVLGKSPILRSCVSVMSEGPMAMGITFGLTKLLGSCGLQLHE